MTPTDVRRAEDLARRKGVSVNALCARAEVSRATWTRWKNQSIRQPYPTSWKRVEAVLAEIVRLPDQSRAA